MFELDATDRYFQLSRTLPLWTSTPPSKTGVYKMRVGGQAGAVDDVSVYQHHDQWYAEESGGQSWMIEDIASCTEWLGPITNEDAN